MTDIEKLRKRAEYDAANKRIAELEALVITLQDDCNDLRSGLESVERIFKITNERRINSERKRLLLLQKMKEAKSDA